MLQANSFALLEELRNDHGGRLQLLLVDGMISVVGTYSREEFSRGCELNVPSRASALNLACPSHRCKPNVGPALLRPGTGSVISHLHP
jgi:hypothetical protein